MRSMTAFQKPDGSVDERMETLAGQVADIHECLVGSLKDQTPGVIDKVNLNTHFRKTFCKWGYRIGMGAVITFVTGIVGMVVAKIKGVL